VKSGGKCFRLTEEHHKDLYDFFENLPIYKELVNDAIISEEFSRTEELLKVVRMLLNNNNIKEMPSKKELMKLWEQMQNIENKTDGIEFLSKLWLFTGQASGKELEGLIIKEIENSFGSSKSHKNFMETIKEWWENSNYFLTESAEFWKHFCSHMLPTYLRSNGKK
jgi:hypothetical protein